MKKQYLLITIFSLLINLANAQFTLDGEFRPRAEVRNGFNSIIPEGTDAAFGVSTRIRLNAGYKTDAYSFYLSLQDVLVWGENRQLAPRDDNNSFSIFQAWAELKLAPGLSTKIGRQTLAYDDQRILGSVGWTQQARNHDVAIFRYKSDSKLKIDLVLGFNQDLDDNPNNQSGFTNTGTAFETTGFFTYKALQMVHLNKKWDKISLSLLALNTTFQDLDGTTGESLDETSDLQTFGTHVKYKSGAFSAALNGYIQTGDRQGEVEVNDAFLAGLDLWYKGTDKVTFGLGAEIISGNDTAESGTSAFFPLYGTNHKFNGLLDLFFVGNHANSVGLIDIHASAKIKTSKSSSLLVKVLNFSGEQDTASGESQLGTEIDLVYAKKFKGYAVKLGYSHIFADDGLYELSGLTEDTAKDTQNWIWAQLVLKPNFLNGLQKIKQNKK